MFAAFHDIIIRWLQNEHYLDGIKLRSGQRFRINERNPDRRLLWDRRIRGLIPPPHHSLVFKQPQQFEATVNEFANLGQYAGQQKIQALTEFHLSDYFDPSRFQTLKPQILEFHRQISMWEDGSWHQQILSNRFGAVSKLVQHAGFDDEWEASRFLADCGYLLPASRISAQEWLRYSGKSSSTPQWDWWLEQLQSITIDPKEIFEIDFTLDSFFSIWPQPGVLSISLTTCFRCPIKAACDHFISENKEDSINKLENLIRLDETDDITIEQLIAYLSGSRFTRSDIQDELLRGFPESIPSMLTHVIPESEDESFFLLLKALKIYSDKLPLRDRPVEGTIFNQSRTIYNEIRPMMENQKQEGFYTLILDNRYRKIHFKQITKGTLNRSLIHPREVFAPAIQLRAAAIVLAHNHPSGDPHPSTQDIEITKRLVEAGNIIGINVLDHVIIGRDTHFSFVDEGLF